MDHGLDSMSRSVWELLFFIVPVVKLIAKFNLSVRVMETVCGSLFLIFLLGSFIC